MKNLFKLKDWKWIIPGKEMLYISDDDEMYQGPPTTCVIGNVYVVEVVDGRSKNKFKIIRKKWGQVLKSGIHQSR